MDNYIKIDTEINFFIFKDIIKYINESYNIYNNNGKFYLKNIKFIFYKDLILFIDMVSNIDITGTLNVFKNDILNILKSSNNIKEKEKKITEYSNNIDINNNDIGINKVLTEIINNLQNLVKYNKNKCEYPMINYSAEDLLNNKYFIKILLKLKYLKPNN